MSSVRLDLCLTRRELSPSREQAQRLIRAGKVRVNGQVAGKPGVPVPEDAEIEIEEPPRFLSRGGDKLSGALEAWPDLPLQGAVAIDVGSSTGGFTDCLLQQGVSRVYAVDVGKGQLHWNLRNDPRVDVREQTNARYLQAEDFNPRPSIGVVDVSFISLKLIYPALNRVLLPGADLISLIKPQFEAGRQHLRKGVVTDEVVRKETVDMLRDFGRDELGWDWVGVVRSPLKGPAGNHEFLARWKLPGSQDSTNFGASVTLNS